jgi:prophage tail gpP-like protein
MPNTMTLTVAGQKFTDWTEFRIDRGIDRCVTDFEISVTERAVGQIPWALLPFAPCTLELNGMLAMTGYIDSYLPHGDANSHGVKIAGRSKTCDLVDCSIDIKGGQFSGYTLDKIARAVCGLFKIDVVIETDMGDAFDDVQLYRHETCFTFLERLCRLRGVLACDDEHGNLVLTNAGATRAAGSIQEGTDPIAPNANGNGGAAAQPVGPGPRGRNVKAYSGTLTGAHRFSDYTVLGQHAVDDDTEGEDATEIEGHATDPGVPRYRPLVMIGESQLTPAVAKGRALWQARYNAARGAEATVTVPGWMQADKTLWRTNQIVPVHMPRFLKLDRDMLVVRVGYRLTKTNAETQLTLGPAEGWTPDPAQVKNRDKKNKGSSAAWNDVKAID